MGLYEGTGGGTGLARRVRRGGAEWLLFRWDLGLQSAHREIGVPGIVLKSFRIWWLREPGGESGALFFPFTFAILNYFTLDENFYTRKDLTRKVMGRRVSNHRLDLCIRSDRDTEYLNSKAAKQN
jgi:hypothetical protein